MTQANYSPLIVSLFLDNPDCYNRSVPVLLKRLQAQLPTEEIQATVQSVRNYLRGVNEDFYREFELLLLENNIGECLTGSGNGFSSTL